MGAFTLHNITQPAKALSIFLEPILESTQCDDAMDIVVDSIQ